MSTLDEINNEKHLVGQALARIDAQREQLSNQLSEFSEPDRIHTREDYYRRLRAKPDKKIVDRHAASPSSWKTPFIAIWMVW